MTGWRGPCQVCLCGGQERELPLSFPWSGVSNELCEFLNYSWPLTVTVHPNKRTRWLPFCFQEQDIECSVPGLDSAIAQPMSEL